MSNYVEKELQLWSLVCTFTAMSKGLILPYLKGIWAPLSWFLNKVHKNSRQNFHNVKIVIIVCRNVNEVQVSTIIGSSDDVVWRHKMTMCFLSLQNNKWNCFVILSKEYMCLCASILLRILMSLFIQSKLRVYWIDLMQNRWIWYNLCRQCEDVARMLYRLNIYDVPE